jgi:hypothetical protein
MFDWCSKIEKENHSNVTGQSGLMLNDILQEATNNLAKTEGAMRGLEKYPNIVAALKHNFLRKTGPTS